MELTKNDVVVVIPVYKSLLSDSEILSFQQCARMLSDYHLVLISPEGLDLGAYRKVYDDFEVVRFNPKFFDGISGYNKLMMSYRFYGQFRAYKYLLIYQLDAYVFKDELLDWCKKGYDYIGAPWLKIPPPVKKRHIIELGKYMLNKIGNGGFSLRKVKTHYRLCLLFWPLIKVFIKNEDFFWCVFIQKINPFYKVPDYREAVAFAMEFEPRKAFEMNNRQLPFGVHAWEKYDPGFWEPYIG